MFLSNVSVRRPVAVCCLIIALGLLGVNAWRKMGLELLPRVDVPYITIVTVYPGASPSEIETDIAKRIEDSVGAIDGLKHMTNSCMEDMCLTFMEFNLDVDVDVAATDVREKLDLVINDFPVDAEKPKVLKFDINAVPIINMALTGDAPIDALYDYADNELSDRLSTLAGVAEVQLIGGSELEVHTLLDREALASRGLSSLDVYQAIQNGIRTIPSGRIRQGDTEYSVKFDADYDTVDEIGALEIENEDGSRCYLRDLGEVVMATDEQRQAAFIDGRQAVAIRIVKKSDANAVRVVDRVKAAMGDLQKQLPGGMELVWVSDDGAFVRATVDSTVSNIWQGILLTAAILFLFLANVRSTIIVAISMPVTILSSVFFLYALDYTLNLSTLLAAGLSVGILVTNSIVVIENIIRRFSQGESAADAARKGSGEVAMAVLASAGTNLVVLFPIAMMGSQVGLFFKPFALTMVIVTVMSLFISFTLTPILCSVLLKRVKPGRRSILAFLGGLSDRFFNRVAAGYMSFLRIIGRHRWSAVPILAVVVAIFVHTLGLAAELGFSFFDDVDRGQVFVKLEYPTRYNLEQTKARVREAEALIAGLPGLQHTLSTIGKVEGVMGQASEGVHLAQLLLTFGDKTGRSEPVDVLLGRVRERLRGYPDAIVTASTPEVIGGQGYAVELHFTGDDLDTLDVLAEEALLLARGLPGIVDPDTTVRAGKPEIRVRPRRAVLSDLGLPPTMLGMVLRANLAGLKAGTFKRGDRTYDIRVKFAEKQGKDQVAEFLFPGAPGHPMLLESLASVEETVTPVQITRRDKQRVSNVLAQLLGTMALGTAVGNLTAALDEQMDLPPGYSYEFSGQYEIMQEASVEMAEAALLAILLTYLVLAAILESFLRPFIILATIPLGLIGVLWALYLTGNSISMFVMLGSVMLIGIVVNNAILIMDQVNRYVAKGMTKHEAMARAAGEKLRPILMITMAAVLGMMPLAVGRGLGSEMRNGIGVASVGGIAVSALLTLIVLPVLYELFTRETPKPKKEKLKA
ncbi:MAG: MMPL family transporter [Nitrospiraceae bacterium]|nr:MMPL family transporter [Nitrospiraceae bacterium]